VNKEQLETNVKEFLLELRLKEKTHKTIIEYHNELNKFIKWFDESHNTEINKSMLVDYKEYLLNSAYSINTKNKNIVVVNKFIKWLGYENDYLKKFKSQQKTSMNDPIYPQEHKRMLRWAKKLNMNDMYLIMKVFAYTGCRVVELKDFTVENVKKTFFKTYNKGKEREIILTTDLRHELLDYCRKEKIESGIIFRSKRNSNQMLNPSTIWKKLQKISGYAKIDKNKIHPHAWRHLFAKAYSELPGATNEELADILGHSNTETTRLYMRTTTKEKQQRMENIKY